MSLVSNIYIFLTAILTTTLGLYVLSTVFPVAGFFARLIASYFSLLACASYGVIASIALRLVGLKGVSQWATARSFRHVMKCTTGVEFVIEDPHNYLNTTRPAVFIGNHQSELDVLMLGAIFPKYCSVTAKRSLKQVPFLGWFMALSGTIFIDRKNTSSAKDAMASAAEQMTREKQSVYMFPEGTRSYFQEPGLLPFKKGAFHLAVQAQVPIIPVVVANYSRILNVKKLRFRSGKIPIKVLKPIPTTNLTASDVDTLTCETRELMLQEIISLTDKDRGHAVPIAAQLASKDEGVVKASGGVATLSEAQN